MDKEFTASVYIIAHQRVLLIHHPKLNKWLPPGGHVEKNETPAETARREAIEETGWDIQFLSQENIHVHYPNATSIARPYLCLLENIPPHGNLPAHQHIDFVYIAKPINQISQPSLICQWFEWSELRELIPEQEIFQETLDVLQHLLLSQNKSKSFSTLVLT